MSRKADCCEAILDAAEAIVRSSGASHLTLDAAAEKAGVSKGGLLYHYPSKEALLQGMLSRLIERVEQDIKRYREELGDVPAADLKAHIYTGFRQHAERKQVSAAILAAGANNPKLLDPVREWHRRVFQEMVFTRQNPMRAALIMLAVDGIWLNDLLQTSPLNPEQQEQLMNELLVLAQST